MMLYMHSNKKAGPYLAVHAADVQKVESIMLPTPDGCLRLIDYLANVEKEITLEEGHRKHDVQAVQDYAFNQIILQNKNFAAKQLKIRVSAHPKVMVALKSAMNERIRQTNNVVSKN